MLVLVSQRNGTGIVTNTFVASALPAEIKGSGLGLLRTGWIFFGATSPIVVGVRGDLNMLREAFGFLAACAGLAAATSVVVPHWGA